MASWKKNQTSQHSSRYDKALPLVGPLVCLLAWWLLEQLDLTSPLFFPSLTDVAHSMLDWIKHGALADAALTTTRALVAFSIAFAFAIPLGALLTLHKNLYRMFSGVIDFLRSIPAAAIFPIFLLIFGIGSEAKIAAGVYVAFWILLVQTVQAISHIPPLRHHLGIVWRMRPIQKLVFILIPQTLPDIITGSKLAISFALILIIVSEMLMTSGGGLGAAVLNGYLTFDTSALYAAILVIGCVGYLMNRAIIFLERRVVHWAGR